MSSKRLIARLDIKGPNLVKGIQFEGLRKLGDPHEFALSYYKQGIDEILFVDIVASLYDRNSLDEIIRSVTDDVFVPITVGGGIRTLDDVKKALDSGADKVAINTAAIKDKSIITKVANQYGSQCMVLSVQAKRLDDHWEAYYDNGRERTGLEIGEWIKEGYELGAGEILLSSVDRDGTLRGIDIDLVNYISSIVPIPVIVGGGMRDEQDFVDAIKYGKADAVSVGSLLHYQKSDIARIKKCAKDNGIDVR